MSLVVVCGGGTGTGPAATAAGIKRACGGHITAQVLQVNGGTLTGRG
jgi:hypothetical protein